MCIEKSYESKSTLSYYFLHFSGKLFDHITCSLIRNCENDKKNTKSTYRAEFFIGNFTIAILISVNYRLVYNLLKLRIFLWFLFCPLLPYRPLHSTPNHSTVNSGPIKTCLSNCFQPSFLTLGTIHHWK